MADLAMIVLKSASQQLGSLLVEEAKFLYGVSDKIEKLQLDLEWLQCFLQDAAKKQHDSPLIRKWISQMRDFAFQAEDIIDKYLVKVRRRREATDIANTIKWFSCALGDAQALHEVGSDIDALSLRMSELSSRLQLCGVQVIAREESNSAIRLVELRRTDSRIEDDDIIVGLDKDVDTVVNQLVSTDKKAVVISGMGGLGKTTLAKKVCNHGSIKGHFQNIVWIYVSQEFQPREIIIHILRKLWGTDEEKEKKLKDFGDVELYRKVREVLEEKSYLIILDDIWNEESWNHLRPGLTLSHVSTTKLLLTTRYDVVHESCLDGEGYLYKQEPLSPEDSWNLLERLASRGQYVIGSEMKSFGEDMLKQCNYLPLATVVIGGILKSKKTSSGWRVIRDNIHSIITAKAGMGFRILDVLELSYSELPSFLRSCFLYLASYPEDFQIYVKKLYYMWAAEGLVSDLPTDDYIDDGFQQLTRLEDVAELYMEELVKRCMVLVEKRSDTGKVKVCRLHDLMRDMCIRKAKEEKFFNITTGNDKFGKLSTSSVSTPTMTTKLHRLAIHGSIDPESRGVTLNKKVVQNARHLRSLMFFENGRLFPHNLLKSWTANSSSVLRVLDLEGAELYHLPKHIGNLVHLRYLNLRSTNVKELPSSIRKLQFLEILDLRVRWSTARVLIPNVLWKMTRLRHLFLPHSYKVCLIPCCIRLRLHSCCHLETLKNLDMYCFRAKDLHELPRLRRFTLQGGYFLSTRVMKRLDILLTHPSVDSGLLAKPMKIILEGITLNEKRVDHLAQSRGYQLSVKKLYICYKISSSFDYVQKIFQNLTSLEFEKTLFEFDPMPVLGRIPRLSMLMLGSDSIQVSRIVLPVGLFPELAYLKLFDLPKLEELTDEEGAMPKLQRVRISCCRNLKVSHRLADTTTD